MTCFLFLACRKALGQPLDLYDIRKFDAALGATLEKLYAAHKAHQVQGGSKRGPLLVDGCPIEDLCLTFVLPGYPEYELKKNGGDVMVDASNVGAYISAVVDANLESGIRTQMEHFRSAIHHVNAEHCCIGLTMCSWGASKVCWCALVSKPIFVCVANSVCMMIQLGTRGSNRYGCISQMRIVN